MVGHPAVPSSPTKECEKCPRRDEENRIFAIYKNATVLITGGTGFLGKVLLEKVLRCLEVRKIFLFIRRKDGMSANERLVKLLQDAIFEKVRALYQTDEQLHAKVEAVQIDLDGDELLCDGGKISEDRLLLETDIVFNVLASVKFNETIRNALVTNVGGTQKILQFAQRMTRLRSIVHVSTLYTNCNREVIEEKIYNDLPLRHAVLLELTSTLLEHEMDHFQHCLLGPMPNTYTLSKKCAEIMIRDDFSHLPIGIFRPPIVISTYQEPLPGWTDNLNGPSGLCMWTVKGMIHTIWGNANKRANLVPVDYCVNAIIVAAYDIMEKHRNRKSRLLIEQDDAKCRAKSISSSEEPSNENCSGPSDLPLYNFMYRENGLTWGKYMEMVSLGFESRLHQAVWNYSYHITAYRPVFRVLSFCFHTIPAVLLDLHRKIHRKKPFYKTALRKTTHFLEMMSYFGLREWTVRNGNMRRLRSLLSGDEARLLEFDMGTINWSQYFLTYIPGIRRYWFKEKTVCGDRWEPAANRRFYFFQQLLQKLLWIWICLQFTRVTSKIMLRNLFAILIT